MIWLYATLNIQRKYNKFMSSLKINMRVTFFSNIYTKTVKKSSLFDTLTLVFWFSEEDQNHYIAF